jgi:glycogen synthase
MPRDGCTIFLVPRLFEMNVDCVSAESVHEMPLVRMPPLAGLVVLPSRWEGLSLTLLEALASGRPAVAAAVPGLAEALPSGAGALVPSADPGALAAEIRRRLTDPGLILTESAAAARQAVDFDVRHTFDQLATVTEQVARARREAPPAPQDAA